MLKRAQNTLRSPNVVQRISHFLFATILFSLPVSLRRRLFAGQQYYCPVCHTGLRGFLVLHRVYHAWCPVCRSLQRHRLVWLFFQQHTGLLDATPKRMLHIAPEPALAATFAGLEHVDYVSADLYDSAAMVKMDICNIQYPGATFDIIYCSHVLEHVPDDRKALREFYRVLTPGGCAVILVPIMGAMTFEDPSITSPTERERLFGQHDHVRAYGPDVQSRLVEAGFTVTNLETEDLAAPADIRRFGLTPGETIFLCRKSSPAGEHA
jgi:SAM-dependent methyltransferase